MDVPFSYSIILFCFLSEKKQWFWIQPEEGGGEKEEDKECGGGGGVVVVVVTMTI